MINIIRSVQNRIYEIRGERVMLDFDLAALYEVIAHPAFLRHRAHTQRA